MLSSLTTDLCLSCHFLPPLIAAHLNFFFFLFFPGDPNPSSLLRFAPLSVQNPATTSVDFIATPKLLTFPCLALFSHWPKFSFWNSILLGYFPPFKTSSLHDLKDSPLYLRHTKAFSALPLQCCLPSLLHLSCQEHAELSKPSLASPNTVPVLQLSYG